MGQIKNIELHIVTDIKCTDQSVNQPKKNIKMQIFVNGAKTDVYDVSPSIRVSDLKELIAFRSGVSVDNQVLMLGGKVHGSLARAGKVKGQTPKVDPQEKKKPKTG